MPAYYGHIFRHQPLKFLYLSYVLLTLLFLKVPFWTLTGIVPAFRPRPTWTLARAVSIRAFRRLVDAVFNTASFNVLRVDARTLAKDADKYGLVWIDAAPELVVGEVKKAAEINKVEAVQVAGYWYGKRDPTSNLAGQPAEPDEKIILQFHSGGWVAGNASPTGLEDKFCNDMLQSFPEFSRLLSVDYRLAQGPPLPIENPFPAALIDATAAYHYLVDGLGFKPSNVLVTGDSAGAHLAVVLARYLVVSAFPTLPPPAGLFLMSPSCDWGKSHEGPGTSMERFRSTDWIDGFVGGYCTGALLGHLPASDAETNPWISPSSLNIPKPEGWFKGLPPTLILAGGVEILVDQMKTLRDRLKSDIGEDKVTYVEVPDGTHILLTLPWHEEEKRLSYKEVDRWMQSTFFWLWK